MSKNTALILFSISIILLLALVWLHTGRLAPPSGGDSIWFHAGLLTLLIGRYIVEYRFTRPNDVFINCIVVFAATSTLSSAPNAEWWEALRWVSLVLAIAALVISWDPGRDARIEQGAFRGAAYQIIISLGQANVIFSIVFVLALISYFDLSSFETRAFAIIWGMLLVVSNLNIERIIKAFRKNRVDTKLRIVGTVHSFLEPSIVFCRRLSKDTVNPRDVVGFRNKLDGENLCYGLVLGERKSADEVHLVVALIENTVGITGLDGSSVVVLLGANELELLGDNGPQLLTAPSIVGTVAKGTNVSRLRFELLGRPKIVAGSLLSVNSDRPNVFYQTFDGVIQEEVTLNGSARAFVEGEAEQVGFWSDERGGFETYDWVARELADVRLIDEDSDPPNYDLKATEMTIGAIPGARYPVNVDVNDFVLFHSAILGVTGSGKSFLTFALVEECAAKSIKVICVDPTGDYQKYLHDAVLLDQRGTLDAFLEADEQRIGIIETGIVSTNPIIQTLDAAKRCLKWCQDHRTEEEILNTKPKILVVLEEAHLLVPEMNFNPAPGMRDRVSEIAQVVLQARKYGLGFLIVSQRTATVVKSVLNQCNTMISFQAFDETGFDFLKNYMGAFHVRSLPNLKPRHGIIVGKASRSRRPLMVKFYDQERSLREIRASSMPLPEQAEPPVDGGPHIHGSQ